MEKVETSCAEVPLKGKSETSPECQRKHDRNQEIIKLLHEYNNIKDATQIVLGALANLEGVTIKQMHLKYGLPLDS